MSLGPRLPGIRSGMMWHHKKHVHSCHRCSDGSWCEIHVHVPCVYCVFAMSTIKLQGDELQDEDKSSVYSGHRSDWSVLPHAKIIPISDHPEDRRYGVLYIQCM